MALTNSGRIRLVAFDLDGTLIEGTVFIWQTLHDWFGSDAERRRRAAEAFRSGRICYREWFEEDLELLRRAGADRAGMVKAISSLRPAPGARETIEELRRRGYRLAVLSGSLDIALEHFYPPDLFDHVFINRIFFDERGLISGGEPTPYDLGLKADGLRHLAAREGLSLEECAFLGDNVNDLEAMRAAGLSLAIDAKDPRLLEAVDLAIDRGNIKTILSLLEGPGGKNGQTGGHRRL